MSTTTLSPSTRASAVASFFRRLVTREGPGAAAEPTDHQSLEGTPASVQAEYQKLIVYHLQRWGVSAKCATVAVWQVGQDKQGREAFVAVVKLSRWERDVAVRLLLGFPLFEKKIRKMLLGSWIAEVSHFEGLLLQTADELLGDVATAELRQLAVTLTGRRVAASARSLDHPDSRP
jgi:hypothetical protein